MGSDADWKFREKVITIIERHIDQSAIVRHDVRLPVLKSKSGRKRQCDIVIEEGSAHRKTFSIVEVQKRGTVPEINEFNGWIGKMGEVGAQHLICVSEIGFPKSIKEVADEIGPTVRLLTFKQLKDGEWPIPPTFCSDTLEIVKYEKLVGLRMEYQHIVLINPKGNNTLPDPFEKIFRIEKSPPLSITDIMDWHLFGNPKNLNNLPRNQAFTLGVKFTNSFQHKTYDGKWVNLKILIINIELFIRLEKIIWEAAGYEQRGWGKVGWVLHASTKLNGTKFDIITPFRQSAPGEYKMGRPIMIGNHKAFLSIGKKGYRAEKFSSNAPNQP